MCTFIVFIFIVYCLVWGNSSSSNSSYKRYNSINKENVTNIDSKNSPNKIETAISNNKIQLNASQENNTQEGFNFFTKVVGVTYENRQQYVMQCYKGQELDLIRDKFNPYDKNAIAVYSGNNQVGFLSKDLAQKLAYKMDTGLKYECFVENITGWDNLYGLNIKIITPSNKEQINSGSNYSVLKNKFCNDKNDQVSDLTSTLSDKEQWAYDDLMDHFDPQDGVPFDGQDNW